MTGRKSGAAVFAYTVDTLRDYANKLPGAELFYLIGTGTTSAHLPEWRAPAELARRAEFVVIPRPGEPAADFPAPFRGRRLKGFPLGVSSLEIHARLKAGLPIELLAPPAVAEAIRAAKLYT